MKKCLLAVAALAAVALVASQANAQEQIQRPASVAPSAIVPGGSAVQSVQPSAPMAQTLTPVRSGLFGRRVRYVVTQTPVMPVTVVNTMPVAPVATTMPAPVVVTPVVATPIVETRTTGLRGRLFMRRGY